MAELDNNAFISKCYKLTSIESSGDNLPLHIMTQHLERDSGCRTKHQKRLASGESRRLTRKSLCVKYKLMQSYRSCMQVHAPGSSMDKLPPPTEQDKHDDAWLAFSACCHDDGLPPKPCISITSPWSKKTEGGETERKRERKMNELFESCPSNRH